MGEGRGEGNCKTLSGKRTMSPHPLASLAPSPKGEGYLDYARLLQKKAAGLLTKTGRVIFEFRRYAAALPPHNAWLASRAPSANALNLVQMMRGWISV